MRVYVVRHAHAAPREDYDRDAKRPLTKKGKSVMESVSSGLAAIGVKPPTVFTSPLVRAVETAEILVKALGKGVTLEECDQLGPGYSAAAVVTFLAETGLEEAAIVGHEPQLGDVVALMVTGSDDQIVDMKKASVACVEFDGPAEAGGGILLWHIVPRVLAALREG